MPQVCTRLLFGALFLLGLSACESNVTQSLNLAGLKLAKDSAATAPAQPVQVTVNPVINNQPVVNTAVSNDTTVANSNQAVSSSQASSSASAASSSVPADAEPDSHEALCRANAGNPSLESICGPM